VSELVPSSVPWTTQHLTASQLGEVPPPLDPEGWTQSLCGLACLRSLLLFHGFAAPSLIELLSEGMRLGAWSAAGWIHAGLLRMARGYGLDGVTAAADEFSTLDALVAMGLPPIVSVTLRFPVDERRGGHLVVYTGRASAAEPDPIRRDDAGLTPLVCFMDPSSWGRDNVEVSEKRMRASFSGRLVALWPTGDALASAALSAAGLSRVAAHRSQGP